MAELAILAAVSIGTSIITGLLTPKTNLPPTDVGRHDDLRIQGSEYGTVTPIIYGRARVAGNIIWSDGVQPVITTTSGSSGGGKKGGTPTPPQNNYTYYTNLALVLCEGTVKGGLRRMWEGTTVAANFDINPVNNGPGVVYQAEDSINTLAHGALIVGDPAASNEQKVQLPSSTSSVLFNAVNAPATLTYDLNIYYSANADLSCWVKINGGTAVEYFFDSTGSFNTFGSITIPAALNVGSANTVEIFRNSGAPAPDIDSISVYDPSIVFTPTFPSGITGAYDGSALGDPNNTKKQWNELPILNGGVGPGVPPTTLSGTLKNGNLVFYNGDETQLQDPFMVSVDGADVTPAYRGLCYVMLTNYQIQNGQLPNFTFEIDEGTHDLADIITDLYARIGLDSTYLDVSQLSGIYVRGLVINQRGELQQILDTLQISYNFDLIDADGKIKAVLRTGISTVTITEEDLRAYEAGSQAPYSALESDFADESQLPREIDITYIDNILDYHTNVQPIQRQLGGTSDPQTMNLPLVLNSTETSNIGLRLISTIFLERAQHQFSLGPKFLYMLPTDVATLTLTEATHTLRIIQFQSALPGLIKLIGTPDKASVYNTVSPFINDGTERPLVDYPSNTKLVLMDVPPVSMTNTVLGYYAAACPRGIGRWNGASLYQELFPDVWDLVTTFPTACTLGTITTGTLSSSPSYDSDGFDITSDLHISLHFGTLESFSAADILTSENNLAYTGGEWVQFCNVVSETPSDPYTAKYHVTKFKRGLFSTAPRIALHGSTEDFVLYNESVKFVPETLRSHYIGYDFKGVSVGQLIDNADTITFSLGTGVAPPVATNLVATPTGKVNSDGSWQTHINGSFNFGQYVGGQRAKIFLKKPEDAAFGNTGIVVYPNEDNTGTFDLANVSGLGIYQIEVITESPYGQTASSGHPTTSVVFSAPPATLLKIFDNTCPKDINQGLGITVGVASSISSDKWFGTNLYRDRGYGYEKIATVNSLNIQLTITDYINNIYTVALVRSPSGLELSGSISALNAGCSESDVVETTKTFADLVYGGSEYIARSRTNSQYVDDLYLGIYGRSADSSGHTFWVAQLVGGTTRQTVRDAFVFSKEHIMFRIGGWCPNVSGTTMGYSTDNSVSWLPTTAGTLYVVLESGTFADSLTATTDEIAGGKNNLFVGREKIGVGTWINLGSGLWEGTDLIRGLDNTDYLQATHVAQEDVILLDENILFLPLEARDIDMTLNFIAVTFGLSIGAALILALFFRGRSITPRPPESFIGPFDSINGDEVLEWIGDSTIIPESYDLEIRNDADSSTLLSQRISPGALAATGDSVSWGIDTDLSSVITLLDDGGINAITSGITAKVDSLGKASTLGGLLFEYEIPSTNPPDGRVAPSQVVIYPEDELYSGLVYSYQWYCHQMRDPSTFVFTGPFYVVPDAYNDGSTDPIKRLALPGDRLSIYLRPDGVAEYHINYTGPSSRPIFTSGRIAKPNTLYKVSVISTSADPNAAGVGIRHPRWLRQNPQWRLMSDTQRSLFGLSPTDPLPANIKARVRQLSSSIFGKPSDWTDGVFTR